MLCLIIGTATAVRPCTGLCQDTLPTPHRPDTLSIPRVPARKDTALLARRAADTLGIFALPPVIGTLDRRLDTNMVRSRNDLHWIDYTYLGDILQTFPGVWVRDPASPGQYSEPTFRGADWRSIGIMMDGRTMDDPASGIFNLSYLAPEYADRVEVITGPRAFLYGLNSTGGAVNLVTKNYNSNTPFTKFDYEQSAFNTESSDGTFSQNISRRLNVTLGFEHQGTSGRYLNSASEIWTGRGKIRYHVSENLNAILSGYLTSTNTDLNGGLDTSTAGSPLAFFPQQASVVNLTSYEKRSRNDIDLSFIGTFAGDTADVSRLTLYYSHDFRQYRSGENLSGLAPFIHSDHTSSWMGALAMQTYRLGSQTFEAGGTAEIRQIEGSPNLGRLRNFVAEAHLRDEIRLGELLTVSGYGRMDTYLKKQYVGVGADATLRLSGGLSLFGGASLSRRLPSYEELYWTDSTVTRVEPLRAENHRVAEAGVRLSLGEAGHARIALFHRTIEDPIILEPYGAGFVFPGVLIRNAGKVIDEGVDASLALRLWVLTLEGAGMYLLQYQDGLQVRRVPKFTASGGVYFWRNLLQDRLELKVGFRGRFQSAQEGERFNPEVLAYVPNTGDPIGYAGAVDFFLIAHIGDAYIHLMWDNLTNVNYYTTPYYPALDRTIRFGIAWEFLN